MDLLQRAVRFLRVRRRRGDALGLQDVARMPARVWVTELDELRHMNNGAYLTALDLPRLDLMERSGMWPRMSAAGYYPVVASQTISYRRSLTLGQRYTVETRVAGYDARSAYVEQRFVVDGEIYARAFVRARFLSRRGGSVPMEEIARVTGVDLAAHPAPAWLVEWAERTTLPPARGAAPSVWDDRGD